jgi:hypothetical protein
MLFGYYILKGFAVFFCPQGVQLAAHSNGYVLHFAIERGVIVVENLSLKGMLQTNGLLVPKCTACAGMVKKFVVAGAGLPSLQDGI